MAAPQRTRGRTVRRERVVPVTRNGRTHHITTTRDEPAPPPLPRDWDAAGRGFITVVAVLLNAGSLAWATVCVGGLLSYSAPLGVALAAAAAFDLAWMMCMVAEYLLRFEPDRAAPMRKAGWWALLIAMSASAANGYRESGSVAVAAASAALPLFAKGGWVVLIRVNARPLDPLSAGWLRAERAELDAEYALAVEELRLDRARAKVRQHRAALNATAPVPRPAPPADDTAGPAPVAAAAPTGNTGTAHVVALSPVGGSVSSTVRDLVDSGVTDLDDIAARVAAVHGPQNRKSLATFRRRALDAAASA